MAFEKHEERDLYVFYGFKCNVRLGAPGGRAAMNKS